MVVASTVLFIIGMSFAYFLVFPVIFGFIVSTTPQGVQVMTDIGNYLDFVSSLLIAFGVAFEVPILVVALVKFGWVSLQQLKDARPLCHRGARLSSVPYSRRRMFPRLCWQYRCGYCMKRACLFPDLSRRLTD